MRWTINKCTKDYLSESRCETFIATSNKTAILVHIAEPCTQYTNAITVIKICCSNQLLECI